MFQSAIFDLDGTLINSLPDITGAMNRSLAKCGLPGFAVEDYRLKVGNGVFKIAERSVGDRVDLMDQVLSYYMPDYAENCCVDSYVYPGIAGALSRMAEAWRLPPPRKPYPLRLNPVVATPFTHPPGYVLQWM